MEEEDIELTEYTEVLKEIESDYARLQSLFVMKKAGSRNQMVMGKLFSNCLILEKVNQNNLSSSPSEKPINFKIEFDFETVFSILRHNLTEKEIQTHSGIPYAIKIEKYQNSVELYSEKPQELELWSRCLTKKLNQRNFHTLFKPIKKIGKGNFASVYLVYKYSDDKEYAVKAFSKEIEYEEDRGKQALQNQIKIMRQLDNKYLMKIEGVYETQNSLYMCVEYLEGGILFDKIRSRHRFTKDQIKLIMRCLLQGIAAMHEKNIMHRDLKPQNIILRSHSTLECVIADFGLATKVDQEHYIFTRCGTPGYVAPEIANLKDKSKYSPVCDVFSLGVIFHILLLGKSPFPGTQCNQVLQQNRACQINFQDENYQKLHTYSLNLLIRMLQKDPAHRITAKECLDHDFFTQTNEIVPEQFYTRSIGSSKKSQCESPLMISKNPKRKRNLKLRDDSCLKFKMMEQMQMNQESIGDRINSPAITKKITRGRQDRKSKTLYPSSNFKE